MELVSPAGVESDEQPNGTTKRIPITKISTNILTTLIILSFLLLPEINKKHQLFSICSMADNY
jgi:hypothetical protein